MGAGWKDVVGILDQAVETGTFPGASALVATADRVLFEHSCGTLGLPGDGREVTDGTVWDLASLTKPLVTVALVLMLSDQGRLRLDDPVARYLPRFAFGDDRRRRGVTIRHLLHHDSGLPAHRRFYEAFPAAAGPAAEGGVSRRESVFGAAAAEPLERDPGSESVYSDLGFLLLGSVVERVADERIDRLVRQRLWDRLGIAEAWFVEVGEERDAPQPASASATLPLQRTAATGYCPWRGRVVHGEVQDENAFAMGGVAPHAGLFATAPTVHRLVQEWVRASRDEGRVLPGALVRHAWERSSGAARSTWALGWDTPSEQGSSAGASVGREAVGHLGYTGTSVWIDRRRGVHVVLLTNRLASDRTGDRIRALRPRFHDAVFAAVDGAPARGEPA